MTDPLVAVPPTSGTGPPSGWPSARNCTVPVAGPAQVAEVVTVAVKLTGTPAATSAALACSAVVVAAVVWTRVLASGPDGAGKRSPATSIATTAKP